MSQNVHEALANHVSSLYGSETEQCIFIVPTQMPENNLFKSIMDKMEAKVIQMDFLKGPDVRSFAKMLKNKAFCAITLYHGENQIVLKVLASMTRILDNNVIVYAGKKRPSDEILLQLNRPLLWAKTSDQQV